MRESVQPKDSRLWWHVALIAFVLFTGWAYFRVNPEPWSHYDYTFRIAKALLNREIGLEFDKEPPGWLNEMIYLEKYDRWTAGFPFGSILVQMPAAIWARKYGIEAWPVTPYLVGIAALLAWYLPQLARALGVGPWRSLLFSVAFLFGTFFLVNHAAAGTWHITLGFAFLGQAAALYHILAVRQPLLSGFWFAVAFGNRSELVCLAPVFYLLWWRWARRSPKPFRNAVRYGLLFSLCPLIVGQMTLAYNQVRFGTPFEFGHNRVPALNDPENDAYRHGLFSMHPSYLRVNADAMLLRGWEKQEDPIVPVKPPWDANPFVWYKPNQFGGSILLTSPFLLLLVLRRRLDLAAAILAVLSTILVLRFAPDSVGVVLACGAPLFLILPVFRARDKPLAAACAVIIWAMTMLLWCHGETGGYQFSYRYATVWLPWAFVLWTQQTPLKRPTLEIALVALSVGLNAYGAWFFWHFPHAS